MKVGQATIRLIGAILVLLLAPSCATKVKVEIPEGTDFSRYRTWGWDLPDDPDEGTESDPRALLLASSLVAEIRHEMSSRGFEFVGEQAGILIRPELRVERTHATVHRSEGDRMLVSHHASPSFLVQGMTRQEVEIYERGWLEVVMTDRLDDRVVYRGALEGRFKGAFAPHLRPSVAEVMASLPAHEIEPPAMRMLTRAEDVAPGP